MSNLTLPAIIKEMERKAGRLEGEAAGLREMVESLKSISVVAEPLLRAVQVAVDEANK